jgi:hypothetical protein
LILLSDPARYAESRRSELHAVTDRLLDGRQFVLGGMVKEFELAFASFNWNRALRHCGFRYRRNRNRVTYAWL